MEFLELGGGENPKYHPNIDIRSLPSVDVVHDLKKGIPFPNESVDYVYSAHLIEHMFITQGEALLREIWRVLRRKGKAEIICPDLEELIQQYKREGLTDRVHGAFCGGQNNEFDVHHTVYDEKALRRVMERVGFRIVEVAKARYNRYGIPEMGMVGEKQ